MSDSSSLSILVTVMAGAGCTSGEPLPSFVSDGGFAGSSKTFGESGSSMLMVGTIGYCFRRAGGEANVTLSVGMMTGCFCDGGEGGSSSAEETVMRGA